MSPERDDYEEEEEEEGFAEDEDEPRSIFSATWFRFLLLGIGMAVVVVLAAPYVLEWFGTSPKPVVSVLRPSPTTPPTPPPSPKATEPPRQPVVKQAPSAPQAGKRPAQVTRKPAAPARPAPSAPAVAKRPAAKPAAPAARQTQVARKPAAPASKPAVTARAPSKGDYWVQVGAFTEADNAARLAAKLTKLKYAVQRATVTRGGSETRNEVFIPGATQSDVYDVVRAKGFRADAVKGGAAVRPLLTLRDAVEISKELTEAGMDVRIRRVGEGKRTLHVVRVGGFPDRAKAKAMETELKGKGIRGFIVKGAPR